MFTIDQIRSAHALVKSGADFPKYIHDIGQLGVIHYATYVSDGQTAYHGSDGYQVESSPKYGPLVIADEVDSRRFQQELKAHQQGQSDYPTFCEMSANCGIEKWVVVIPEMTCTYYDKAGNKILEERIPAAE